MSTGFLAVTAEEVSITTRLLMEGRIPIKTEGHNLLFHFQMLNRSCETVLVQFFGVLTVLGIVQNLSEALHCKAERAPSKDRFCYRVRVVVEEAWI